MIHYQQFHFYFRHGIRLQIIWIFYNKATNPDFNLDDYPEHLWFQIFLRCDKETLLNVEQTCHQFNKLLDTRFWIAKCHHDEVSIPSPAWNPFPKPLPPSEEEENTEEPAPKTMREENEKSNEPQMYNFNYKRLYFKNPVNRNLAYPMEADTTLQHLEQHYNLRFAHQGNGIIVETVPQSRGIDLEDDKRVKSCFATSYGICSRYFEINLLEIGLDAHFIDHIRPKIVVRELCCCRSDCGAKYTFRAQLLKDGEAFDQNVVLPRFKTITKEWVQWEGGKEWETAEHLFEDYPSGVSRIAIMTSGKDSQFWAGHYGPKFTNTEVIITMPAEPNWRNKDDVEEPEKEVVGHEQNQFFYGRMRAPVGLRARFLGRRGH